MNRSFEQELETRLTETANAYTPRPDIDSVKADTILSAPTVRHPRRYRLLMQRFAAAAAVALVVSGVGVLLLRQPDDNTGTVAADESANTAESTDESSLVDPAAESSDESLAVDPVIRHQHKPVEDGAYDSAEVKGEVRLDGQCVFVGAHLAVWPYGTSWDADLEAVILPNGEAVPLGAHVYGGGGYPRLDQLDETIDAEAIEQAEGCVTNDAEVAVINNYPEAVEPDSTNGTPPPHSGEATACGIPYLEPPEEGNPEGNRYPNFWFAGDVDSGIGAFESEESERFGGLETDIELVDSVVYRTTVPVDEKLNRLEDTNVTVRWPADTETAAQPGYELELQKTDNSVLVWVKDRSQYEYVVAEAYTESLNQRFAEAGGCTTLSITFEHEGQTYGPAVIEY